MIYLDHAATTPISKTALEVYVNVSQHYFGNPSSLHDIGSEAKQILDASRKTIANLLHCESDEIYFTASGTEANQLAIQSLLSSVQVENPHVIISNTEHSSVRNFVNSLKDKGYEVSEVAVDEHGLVSIESLKKLITEQTVLVSIQHANSETGVIQQVEEIGMILREKGILFHSDCVQTFCKIGVEADWVDALSVSSHKVYGPKGVGAFFLSKKHTANPAIKNTTQEKGLRAGTENVPAVAAFAAASKQLFAQRNEEFIKYTDLRQRLLEGLTKAGISFTDEGKNDQKLPHILGLRFRGIEGQYLMLECSQAGLALSTGSACKVGEDAPNQTMKAFGRSDDEAREFIRISLGKENSPEQIPVIIEKIATILERHFAKVKF